MAGETLYSRLMAALFSLFVSVPTAALIWFWVNRELSYWGGFVGSQYLLISVAVCAVIAFVAPRFFPILIGKVWHAMRWWAW